MSKNDGATLKLTNLLAYKMKIENNLLDWNCKFKVLRTKNRWWTIYLDAITSAKRFPII